MRKVQALTIILTLASLATTIGLARNQEIQSVIGNVFLQNTTPGTVQIGHATIGGTFRAGQVDVSTTKPGTIPMIGNNTAAMPNQLGGSFSVAGANSTALRGTSTYPDGIGIGVYGESRALNGMGVRGVAKKINGASAGVSGLGFYGGEFATNDTDGAAVHAGKLIDNSTGLLTESNTAISFNAPVIAYQQGLGLCAQIVSFGEGVAVNSYSTSFNSLSYNNGAVTGIDYRQSGLNNGVSGTTHSPDGVGVMGFGTGTGANVALKGVGNFVATGTKAFEIDHPLDPQNATLYHYCAEGPDPYNVYRGNATLDARGEAWVSLPDYYDAINTDPVYQLTPIGGAAVLFVAAEVHNNRFKIGGGKPGMKASWVVTARRNDAYVRHFGVVHEAQKSELERGSYLAPEAYGLDQTHGAAARTLTVVKADGSIVRGDGLVLKRAEGRRP